MRRLPNNSVTLVSGVAMVTVIAVALQAIWTQSSDLGGINVRLDGVERRLERVEAAVTDVGGKIDQILQRIQTAEADPIQLLVKSGIPAMPGFAATNVGGRMVLFPKTPEAESQLVSSGYEKQQLSPVIFGYVMKTGATKAPN